MDLQKHFKGFAVSSIKLLDNGTKVKVRYHEELDEIIEKCSHTIKDRKVFFYLRENINKWFHNP